VLAECKAHRLTDPARRGAPARIKTKAGELVLTPLEQASAAAEYMNRGARDFKNKQGRVLTVSEGAEVIRIAVSFERIDPLSLQVALFADDSETTPGAVFWLADLLMTADLLRDPSSLTAYLVVRNELVQHPAVLAYMEADLLGGFIYDRLSTVRKAAASGTFDEIDLGYSADEVNAYALSKPAMLARVPPCWVLARRLVGRMSAGGWPWSPDPREIISLHMAIA